ncbi:MAG TPA: GNAT family N-acetyltransferase [bacterium]|nr:GNAT family N-acetyltransferase [bacterium]
MTDAVDLRPFDAGRIGEIVAVWNAAAGSAFPLREALFRQNTLADPHFDPAGASLARDTATGRVIGCGIAKVAREPLGADGLRPDRGWLSFMVVHPAYQRRGIGTALLRAGEAFLRARERPRAVLGGDPAHFFPGVPDETGAAGFFEAGGFALRGEAYDLHRSLAGYETPATVTAARSANPEIEVRPLAAGDEDALLRFLDATFPGRWRYTIARFLRGGGPIGDVMGVVRRGAVHGFALLFHPRSRWIGPSIAWAPPAGGRSDPAAGGLGPMGLAPELRGRGLGHVLLDRAVGHLAALGVREMVIDWTILLDFYGTLGFVPRRRYRHGERAL